MVGASADECIQQGDNRRYPSGAPWVAIPVRHARQCADRAWQKQGNPKSLATLVASGVVSAVSIMSICQGQQHILALRLAEVDGGGPARSSGEGPVMGPERRGRAVHGRLEVNPSGEEPTDRPRHKNAGLWEPYDGRLSRTVLREREVSLSCCQVFLGGLG